MKIIFITLSLIFFSSCSPLKPESIFVDKNSEIAIRIDNYLKSATTLGFSGSVVVSQGNNPILQNGYGLSNRESRISYTPNTIQSCGSITKLFTAAAILLLESQNSLTVNDPISKYFSDVPKEKKNITIHQLLTHTSGIVGGVGPDDEPLDKESYLARLWFEPLEFDPGLNFNYSNAGYSLLGMIIESVSGKNYEVFLKENFFMPLKMDNTGYLITEKDTGNLAIGYRDGNFWGKIHKRGWLEDGPNWHLRANGGIHTTAEDMYKWSKVMQANVIFDDKIINQWTNYYGNENNVNSNYGYGLVIYEDLKYGKVITHDGSNGIFSAHITWLPEKNIFYYIQSNSSLFSASEISNNILSAAFDPDFKSPPFIDYDYKAQPEYVKNLEGTYELNGATMDLKSDHTRLNAKLNGQPMLDLFLNHSEEKQQFFSQLNARTLVALSLLKNGKVDALKDLMPKGENSIQATQRLLKQIEQIGNLQSLDLIGSFENKANSRFSKFGAYTTFVHARFENWNRYWNFEFDENGNYLGTYSGPWPTFTIIPSDSNRFIAINQEIPNETAEVILIKNCFNINNKNVCNKE